MMRVAVGLTFAAVLALGQEGNLALTNVRLTQGLLGPTRADLRVLPGDTLWLEFAIEGITVAVDGKVHYSMALEVADSKGKTIFRQNPADLEALASLGGRSVPAQAHVDVGLDQPAGDYTVKVTVTDRASKQTRFFTQKLSVLPAAFGIVQLKASSDPEGTVPAALVATGETVWINWAIVGFGRDKVKQQPDLEFEMRILDESGKPTLTKPDTGVIRQNVPPSDKLLGGQFAISANRPGKFVVELKAVDKIASKSATASFPLTVRARR
jgi:hypothetical protein